MASMASPYPGQVYNIADDDPASRESVLDFVQAELHVNKLDIQPAQDTKEDYPAKAEAGR